MRFLIASVVVFAFAIVAWKSFVQPSYEHRFRIAIMVSTPSGERSGSSVWSVICAESVPSAGVPTGGCKKIRGEAIFVDFGNGQNLVGLMAQGPLGDRFDNAIAHSVFGDRDVPPNARSWYSYAPNWQGVRVLRGRDLITLVTIRDLGDPTSVQIVEPTDSAFVAAFGPGYRLQSVTLEMVPAGFWPLNLFGLSGVPTTSGIEKRIPFLVSHRRILSNVISNMPPRYQVGLSQFIRG